MVVYLIRSRLFITGEDLYTSKSVLHLPEQVRVKWARGLTITCNRQSETRSHRLHVAGNYQGMGVSVYSQSPLERSQISLRGCEELTEECVFTVACLCKDLETSRATPDAGLSSCVEKTEGQRLSGEVLLPS